MQRLFRSSAASGGGNGWRIQFFQHLITGAIATVAHYAVMWFALNLFLLPTVATSIGFIAGATTRFLFAYFHIFEPESHISGALIRFLTALGIQMALNAGILALFMEINLPVWPAQILTTAMLTIFNFLVAKFWVFR